MSGVFGGYSIDGKSIADEVLEGTVSLQHRGEEGCGVSLWSSKNGNCKENEFLTEKDNKLAFYFFRDKFGTKERSPLEVLREISPSAAIGHTLYEASGGLQPVEEPGRNHVISLAMDGVLLGYMGKNDSVMRALLSRHLDDSGDIYTSVERVMEEFDGRGSYCVSALIRDRNGEVNLVAFRDPRGIKPLGFAKKDNKYFIM